MELYYQYWVMELYSWVLLAVGDVVGDDHRSDEQSGWNSTDLL